MKSNIILRGKKTNFPFTTVSGSFTPAYHLELLLSILNLLFVFYIFFFFYGVFL